MSEAPMFREPVQPGKMAQPTPKRQKLDRDSTAQATAAYWDNVSKVWLTKLALKELDRRVRLNAPLARHQARPPVKRSSLAKSTKNRIARLRTDPLGTCSPQIVKKINRFARNGGPDLSGLRNYSERTYPSDRTISSGRSTKDTSKTMGTGPYDRQFQQILVDNCVYPDGYEYPDGSVPAGPNNWDDISRMLAQPRLSPTSSQSSDGRFKLFKRADTQAAKEEQVRDLCIPYIEGKAAAGRCRSGGIPFANLDDPTDTKLAHAKPDIFYGARPEQLDREVRDALGRHIVPSTQSDLPIAPNFFLEVKGPEGSLAVAGRQACYYGALGARGMHSLRTYRQSEPVYDNHSHTLSCVYHGGALKIYASHTGPPRTAGGRPEIYMNKINAYDMTGNPDTFRAGVTAYRNARDWAKAQRDAAIAQANEHANHAKTELPADAECASPALSFATAAENQTYSLTQETRTSLDKGAPRGYQESDSMTEDPAEYALLAKRFRKSIRQSSQQKRHNAYRIGKGNPATSRPSAFWRFLAFLA